MPVGKCKTGTIKEGKIEARDNWKRLDLKLDNEEKTVSSFKPDYVKAWEEGKLKKEEIVDYETEVKGDFLNFKHLSWHTRPAIEMVKMDDVEKDSKIVERYPAPDVGVPDDDLTLIWRIWMRLNEKNRENMSPASTDNVTSMACTVFIQHKRG